MSRNTEFVSLALAHLDIELMNEQKRHDMAVKRMRGRIARLQKQIKEYGKKTAENSG